MATITQAKFQDLLDNAPKGVTEVQLRQSLQQRGHIIETPPQQKKSGLDKASNILDAIFGGKQIGEGIGGLIVKSQLPADQRKNVAMPTGKQLAGDTAGIALTLGTLGVPAGLGAKVGLPAIRGLASGASLGGRLAEGAAIGAGFAGSGALKQNETPSLGGLAGGAALGAAIPLAGAGIQKTADTIADRLPTRLASSALKLTPKEAGTPQGQKAAQQLLSKPIGTTKTLLADSSTALDTLDTQINTTLASMPQTAAVKRADIIKTVFNSNPDFTQAQLSNKDIFGMIRAAVPKSATLLSKRTLTLQEANKLRQYLDRGLGKGFFQRIAMSGKDPALTQEVINAYSRNLSNVVKQQAGLEAQFAEYSKEISLFKSLNTLQERQAGKDVLSLTDMLAAITGFAGSGGNPVAAATALGARRALQSTPTLTGLAKGAIALPKLISGKKGVAAKIGLFQALKEAYEH